MHLSLHNTFVSFSNLSLSLSLSFIRIFWSFSYKTLILARSPKTSTRVRTEKAHLYSVGIQSSGGYSTFSFRVSFPSAPPHNGYYMAFHSPVLTHTGQAHYYTTRPIHYVCCLSWACISLVARLLKKNNHAHIVSCFMPVSKNRLYAVFFKKKDYMN
jgi:hypothetical protein